MQYNNNFIIQYQLVQYTHVSEKVSRLLGIDGVNEVLGLRGFNQLAQYGLQRCLFG